jgi:hypothetical protein
MNPQTCNADDLVKVGLKKHLEEIWCKTSSSSVPGKNTILQNGCIARSLANLGQVMTRMVSNISFTYPYSITTGFGYIKKK